MIKVFLRAIHFFILLIFFLLQVVLLGRFNFYGSYIDLLMVAVIAVSIIDGYMYGMIFGFVFGLLLDLLLGGIIGVNAMVLTIAAFAAFRIFKLGFKARTLSYIIIVPVVSLIGVLLPNLVYYIFGYGIEPTHFLISLFLQPAINTLLVFPIFALMGLGRVRKEEIGFSYKKKI